MKKSLLLFIFIFSSFFAHLFAQNVLILSKPNSGETEIFRKGSYLVFGIKSDKSVHEGFIRSITDSSLVFDEAQVSLSQIDILAGSTKGKIVAGRVANAVATGLIIAGSAVFNCGLDFFAYSDGYYYWPLGGTIWLGGAVIAGIGYAFDWASSPLDHAVRVRNYRDWNANIIKEEEQPIQQEKISAPQDSTQTVILPVEGESKREEKKKK